MDKEPINHFELHYFFDDEQSHSMDAFVRNKCESEILAIIKLIAAKIEIEVDIENEPYEEGGLVELWKFIGDNGTQLTFLASIVTLYFTVFPRKSKQTKELETLQIENLKLTNQQLKEHSSKTEKKEDKNINKEFQLEDKELESKNWRLLFENIKNELNKEKEIDSEKKESIITYFNNDLKLIKRRSNFYQTLKEYPKVTKVSTSYSYNKKRILKESIIEKEDFNHFILLSNELPKGEIYNAEIEVSGPILTGKGKWKGNYDGQPIDFSIKDKKYKNDVEKGKVSFQRGYKFKCVLILSRKINEVGEIEITNHSVKIVLSESNGTQYIETNQGKKYINKKRNDDDLKNQIAIGF